MRQLALLALVALVACTPQPGPAPTPVAPDGAGSQAKAPQPDAPAKDAPEVAPIPDPGSKFELADSEWAKRLTPEQYRILRKNGTEYAGSGKLLKNKRDGVYVCAGCDAPLFDAGSKFESGTGWPSFYQPLEQGRVGSTKDTSHGMTRVEVHCDRCGGHLGHVFPDGPKPTGLRYCINSVSLGFVERERWKQRKKTPKKK